MNKKVFKFFAIVVCLLLILSNFKLGVIVASLNEADANQSAKYVADEVVIKFKPQVSFSQIDQFNQSFKTRFTRTRRFADFVTLRIPAGLDAEIFAQQLAADPRVEYAEPNFIANALMVPNDPYYSYQWHFDNSDYGGVQAESAWDISTGSGVTVAIIDTGIAYENYGRQYKRAPDLAGTCFEAGYDFVNNDSHPNDDEGHGTHVAGTVAQATNNNQGTAGLAYSSCLMPVKVLNKQGSGTYADIAEGIRFATDNGAQIINLSLGGSADAEVLREAVAYAYNQGTMVVAAAGNDNSSSVLYPAAYDDYVIAVGATRYDETLAYYSNYGPSVDLVAPGGDLTVDQNGDGYGDGVLQQTFDRNPRDFGYWFTQGTSMASPHVAAAAAMIVANGVTGPDNIRVALESSAEDLGGPGRDNTFGWGLVDVAAALGIVSSPTLTPSPTSTPTPTLSLTPSPTSTPSSTPTPSPTSIPTQTPTPTFSPTPTSSPTPSPEVACWDGDNQYLYRNKSQAKKFCKCAQGTYEYNSYNYSWQQETVSYYLNSENNENWGIASRSSRLPVNGVTCSDGITYPTNQSYNF